MKQYKGKKVQLSNGSIVKVIGVDELPLSEYLLTYKFELTGLIETIRVGLNHPIYIAKTLEG